MEQFELFVFGSLGALLTVYLIKQEAIPEFRPLFDVDDKQKEVIEHKEHIKKTEKSIDTIQAKLEKNTLIDDEAARLTTVLESSQKELHEERERLQMLEGEIKQNQFISRSMGFLFYIALGGVFGAMLAGMVQITWGSSDQLKDAAKTLSDLPNSLKAFVIGATWTSYLSTIGLRAGQKKADERIEAAKKESAETNEALKKELSEVMTEKITEALKATKAEQPKVINDLVNISNTKIDQANMETQKEYDFTRSMVQRDINGLL